MGKCAQCGGETKENTKYCKACGADVSRAAGSMSDKKARVMTQERRWGKPAVIAAALVVVLAAAWIGRGLYMSKRMGEHPAMSPIRDAQARTAGAQTVQDRDGSVRIPVSSVEDGQAHFFAYSAGNKTIRFFVMKAGDGSIRTALDACVACNHAKLGYRQESGYVVCNNCGMAFKPTDIGAATGGCNPIPVNKTMDGQMVVLKTRDLEDGAKYF